MATESLSNIQNSEIAYDYCDVVISLDNCILSEDILKNTPSSLDDIPEDHENYLRFFGCELIQKSGILLKLPQVAMATGQILFQRFFYSKSFLKHDYEVITVLNYR
uniref:Cyclin-L1 (Trinotate prediction) n=1 Tax=Myxobolus squamalis TaxID=59785 RepID=A0A6B2G5E4_MYXSQ